MIRYVMLLLPALAAWMALKGGGLAWKLLVPASCALVTVALFWLPTALARREVIVILLGFLSSLVGDYFLATRSGHSHYFELGIVSFLIAHGFFLRYALWNGGLSRGALFGVLAMFLPYYLFALFPRFKDPVLAVAVFLYLVVSCAGFAAACGIRIASPGRPLYVVGIGLLLFSDTLISLSEFLRYRALSGWILPTYYAFLICIAASVLVRRVDGATKRSLPPDP